LRFVYAHESISEIRGSPARLLGVIDEFGRTKKYLMNVGEDKGRIVTDLIAEVKPRVMIELGGYVGYSALLFGDALRRAGGGRYFSLEKSPEFAAIIMSLIDLAGLSDVVKVVVGPSGDSMSRLYADGILNHVDLLFLDHHKPAYITDLKLCETLRLVTPGTVLAADNVIKPGNPPYLQYVRSSVQTKRDSFQKESNEDTAVYANKFAGKIKDQYVKRQKAEKVEDAKGNPNLIYESKLFKSFEPTGIPVSQNT
jgi:catechol O-methyltransferase